MPAEFHHISEQPVLSVVGDAVRPLVQTSSHEIFEIRGPEGSGPPPHAHPWSESFIVLDGRLQVVVEGEERVLRSGDVAHIPAGTVHLYRILDPGTRFLASTSGQRAGAFFVDMDRHAPHGVPTPEAMPTIIEVARRNGLTSPLF